MWAPTVSVPRQWTLSRRIDGAPIRYGDGIADFATVYCLRTIVAKLDPAEPLKKPRVKTTNIESRRGAAKYDVTLRERRAPGEVSEAASLSPSRIGAIKC
jgi:hypothetical protein